MRNWNNGENLSRYLAGVPDESWRALAPEPNQLQVAVAVVAEAAVLAGLRHAEVHGSFAVGT